MVTDVDYVAIAPASGAEFGVFNGSGNTLYTPDYVKTIQLLPVNLGSGGDIWVEAEAQKAYKQTQSTTTSSRNVPDNLFTMGSWDAMGVPNYLMAENDQIDQQLIDDISASLPETRPVPQYNPEYLTSVDMDLKLSERAEAWVTFVHEGAGWRNGLGYYTYNLDEPPQSPTEIDSLFIIFPNVSYRNSGGGLETGNKIYLGDFPANTGIGWFLVPDGWSASEQNIVTFNQVKYSDHSFNDYTTEPNQQHLILLNDASRELILMGFEDTTRPGGDNDFNDAVFYTTVTPYRAVITEAYNEIKKAIDADGDGVLDHLDDFPNDPNRASYAWFPSSNGTATLLFEDLWPDMGDYDFNDLVCDYRISFILNSSSLIKEMVIDYTLKAVGGTYRNGLALTLPLPGSAIAETNGQELQGSLFNLQPNGAEWNENGSVIPLFDDATSLLPPPEGYRVSNAIFEQPKVAEVSRTLSITFNTAVPSSELGDHPFDFFLVANQNRAVEIHLPDNAPTTAEAHSYLSTGDDASAVNEARYYRSATGLPWGLHISNNIPHAREAVDFLQAYPKFKNWAESAGTVNNDWYLDLPEHRNPKLLFTK